MSSVGVEVLNLTRHYGRRGKNLRVALDDVSFSAAPGEVLGLLGPNGAGKTTTVKILTTLLHPTGGTARVNGHDVVSAPRSVQRSCGLSLGGESGLYGRLNLRDNLRFFGSMYGLQGRPLQQRIDELLERVDLTDRSKDRVETFSRGMKQRVHIARCLLHDPEVVILDEPSSGLDPQSARTMRQVVQDLASEGRTVLLTTHDLVEAENLCRRVLIINQGRITREASPQVLREQAARTQGTRVHLHIPQAPDENLLELTPGLLRWEVHEERYTLHTTHPREAVHHALGELGGQVDTLQVSPPSLEEAYLSILEDA